MVLKTKEAVREYIYEKTGITVNNFSFPEGSRVYESDLGNINKLFCIWKRHINPKAYRTFLKNLISDFVVLHCCAVTYEVKSPCYLGKMLDNDLDSIIEPLPKRYTACQLKTQDILTESNRSISPRTLL